MLEWYRVLNALRRATPDLLDDRPGQALVTFDVRQCWILVRRGRVRIAANLGRDTVEIDALAGSRSGAVALASAGSVALGRDGALRLPPDSVAIVLAKDAGSALGAEEEREPGVERGLGGRLGGEAEAG
jgi:maltooligosyltrehalose trehalohydrolase